MLRGRLYPAHGVVDRIGGEDQLVPESIGRELEALRAEVLRLKGEVDAREKRVGDLMALLDKAQTDRKSARAAHESVVASLRERVNSLVANQADPRAIEDVRRERDAIAGELAVARARAIAAEDRAITAMRANAERDGKGEVVSAQMVSDAVEQSLGQVKEKLEMMEKRVKEISDESEQQSKEAESRREADERIEQHRKLLEEIYEGKLAVQREAVMLEMVQMENKIHELQNQVRDLKKKKKELEDDLELEREQIRKLDDAYVEEFKRAFGEGSEALYDGEGLWSGGLPRTFLASRGVSLTEESEVGGGEGAQGDSS
uniref:Uncharacterized protein n=1 Tax=Hemiselmis andersenii TaxID=464988 RepID=A0A6U2IY34_HEMAN